MIIGVDVGTKRSGVAVSDAEEKLAFPRDTVPTKKLVEYLLVLKKETGVDIVVLGLSENNKGEHNEVMKEVSALKETLEEKGMHVELVSETYTTQMALRHVDREHKDEAAAALILQTFLDMRRSGGAMVQ